MPKKLYYIRNKKKPRRLTKICLLLLTVLLTFVISLNVHIYPFIYSYINAKMQTELTEKINNCVGEQLLENKELFSNLVTISTKNDGSVASMSINNANLLVARSLLVADILKSINYYDQTSISIPVGSITKINLFSGKGPYININAKISNGFNAYFENDFSELGINQTLYRIFFIVTFDIDLIMPSKIKTITINQSFPVVSTVIVGEVPDAYTEIRRLTGDITESDIDDIYDFGAALQ